MSGAWVWEDAILCEDIRGCEEDGDVFGLLCCAGCVVGAGWRGMRALDEMVVASMGFDWIGGFGCLVALNLKKTISGHDGNTIGNAS